MENVQEVPGNCIYSPQKGQIPNNVGSGEVFVNKHDDGPTDAETGEVDEVVIQTTGARRSLNKLLGAFSLQEEVD